MPQPQSTKDQKVVVEENAQDGNENPQDHSDVGLVVTILGQWAGNAAMHGLPNITRTKALPKKIAWSILLLGGLGILVFQVQDIIRTYYSYPITLVASSAFFLPTPFPAVTVCNLNPARMKQVQESMSYSSATTSNNDPQPTTAAPANSNNNTATTKATQPPTASPPSNNNATTTNSSSSSSSGPPPTSGSGARRRRKRAAGNESPQQPARPDKYQHMFTGDIYASNDSRTLSNMGQDKVPESTSAVYTFMDYYNQLNFSTKVDIGYPIEQFLIDCNFAGRYCSKNNFTRFLHPTFGNCFTFNANIDPNSDSASTQRPGPLDGLIATFYIDQESYLKSVSQSAGIRVVIHERTKMPFPEETGINVPTGMETSIGMTRRYRKRLAFPYSDDCQDNWESVNKLNSMYSTFNNYSLPNVNYSQVACRKTCVQKVVERKCQCSSPNLPISSPQIDPLYSNDFSICMFNFSNHAVSPSARCMSDHEVSAYAPCKEFCKPDCEEYYYETTVSMSTWPSLAYETDAYQLVSIFNPTIKDAMNKKDNTNKASFMKESFVKIRVYYQDAVTHSVISTEGYTIVNLLSDMGGQVGLWLGLSVLTLFEIIEVIVDIITLCVQHSSEHRKAKQEKKLEKYNWNEDSDSNIIQNGMIPMPIRDYD